ncbi:MAG: DNA polymerase III subunit gamma/tau [Lachnospiraceae bacterium]|nr:DNA polymerase III subunit gamma/tau [Lachnospiraceae bacterium]
MSYTALYRKWRPARFEDVRGQDAIVKTLTNQLAAGHIGHAYLFTGTRGVGKTTMAKILARAVNCEHPVNGSPCNECASCRAILSGNSVNVIEIDAASNNGVDNIREIREEVRYKPTEGKYRVYIIDEVHMLSPGAFNALLKTLEEPPEYVIFILATTEVQKIPVTVLSRCQRYDFRRLSLAELKTQLEDLLRAENVQAEEQAVLYLARQADGSSRDALSLLERCIAIRDGDVLTYEKVLEVLGAVDQSVYSSMLRAILDNDVQKVIGLVDEILASGREITRFVTELIQYLRNILLVQTENPGEEVLGISKDNMERIREESLRTDLPEIMRFIRILSALLNEMRYAAAKRTLLELALFKMMMPAMDRDEEALLDRVRYLEEKVAVLSKGQIRFDAETPLPAGKPAPEKPVKKIEVSQAAMEEYQKIKKEWKDILFGLQHPLMRSLLQGTSIVPTGDGRWAVLFTNGLYYASFEHQGFLENLKQVLKARYGKEFALILKCGKEDDAEPVVVLGNRIPGIEMDIEEGEIKNG